MRKLFSLFLLSFVLIFLSACGNLSGTDGDKLSDKDSQERIYTNEDPEECKRIQFACIPGRIPFYDETGCGCEIGSFEE